MENPYLPGTAAAAHYDRTGENLLSKTWQNRGRSAWPIQSATPECQPTPAVMVDDSDPFQWVDERLPYATRVRILCGSMLLGAAAMFVVIRAIIRVWA